MLAWILQLEGWFTLPTAFDPVAWHIHEMLFGFVAAVIAGFLLTAIPNWTGRLPLRGPPLIVLFSAWILGRLALTFSAYLGAGVTMACDLALLLAAAAWIAACGLFFVIHGRMPLGR